MGRRRAQETGISTGPSPSITSLDITLPGEQLASLVSTVGCAVASSASPITACAHVVLAEQKLTMTTTSPVLRCAATVQTGLDCSARFLVDHARLNTAVSACEKEPVRMRWSQGTHKLIVTSTGKRFELPTLVTDDFPTEPESKAITGIVHVSAKDLKWLLDATNYAVPRDSAKSHLAKVVVEADSARVTAIAANGGIATFAIVSANNTSNSVNPRSVRLGLAGLSALKNMLGDDNVTIVGCGTHSIVSIGDTVLTIANTEGDIPIDLTRYDSDPVIASATVDRKVLASAIKTISRLASEEHRGVYLEFLPTGIMLSNRGYEQFAARELVPVISVGKTGPHICLNRKWLLDACQWTDGAMSIAVSDTDNGLYATIRTLSSDSSESRSAITYMMGIIGDDGYVSASDVSQEES